MDDQQTLYRASARAGGGHPGQVRSQDGVVQVRLAVPRELGGSGAGGTNPEQLLATAYAACFYTALEQAAREAHVPWPADAAVECEVALGRRDGGGFQLDVQVAVAGGSKVDELVRRAAALWPHAPGVAPQVRIAAAASAA